MKKTILILSVIVTIAMLLGCVTPQPPPMENVSAPNVTPPQPNQTNATVTPPAPPAYLPLHLQYRLPTQISQNGTESNVLIVDYYWDQVKDCNGRNALVGISRADFEGSQNQYSPWYKTTVYLDDGSFGRSKELSEGNLLFNGAKATDPQQFNLPFMVNNWFSAIGRNFSSDPAWTGNSPTILDNVSFFQSFVDVSIVKEGMSSADGFQCTGFSIGMRGTGNGPGGVVNFCIIGSGSEVPVPVVVSMGMENTLRYDLKKMDHETLPVKYFPECITVVKCTAPAQPTQAETSACNAQNGSFDQVSGDDGCVSGYVCKTNRDRAIEDMTSNNNPACGEPSELLISKYSKCRWEQNRNWDYTRDQNGCVTDVICR